MFFRNVKILNTTEAINVLYLDLTVSYLEMSLETTTGLASHVYYQAPNNSNQNDSTI